MPLSPLASWGVIALIVFVAICAGQQLRIVNLQRALREAQDPEAIELEEGRQANLRRRHLEVVPGDPTIRVVTRYQRRGR